MTIHRVKIMKGKEGGRWVALPSYREGEEWRPLVEFDKETNKRFCEAVLQALKEREIYGTG